MAKVDPEREKVFWKIVDETMELLSIDNRRITFRERISALPVLDRILHKDKDDDADAGRTVRKYQRSFTTNAARGRTDYTGPTALHPDTTEPDGDTDEFSEH